MSCLYSLDCRETAFWETHFHHRAQDPLRIDPNVSFLEKGAECVSHCRQ
jgi:hypothetical protein